MLQSQCHGCLVASRWYVSSLMWQQEEGGTLVRLLTIDMLTTDNVTIDMHTTGFSLQTVTTDIGQSNIFQTTYLVILSNIQTYIHINICAVIYVLLITFSVFKLFCTNIILIFTILFSFVLEYLWWVCDIFYIYQIQYLNVLLCV